MLATALKRHVGKCILDFVRIKFIATKKSKHKTVSLNLTPLLEITPVPADMSQNIWFYLIWLSGLILFTLLPYWQFLWYHWECSEWYMSMRRYGINLQVPNQYLRSWSSEGLQLDVISIPKYCPIYVFKCSHIIILFVLDMWTNTR